MQVIFYSVSEVTFLDTGKLVSLVGPLSYGTCYLLLPQYKTTLMNDQESEFLYEGNC